MIIDWYVGPGNFAAAPLGYPISQELDWILEDPWLLKLKSLAMTKPARRSNVQAHGHGAWLTLTQEECLEFGCVVRAGYATLRLSFKEGNRICIPLGPRALYSSSPGWRARYTLRRDPTAKPASRAYGTGIAASR